MAIVPTNDSAFYRDAYGNTVEASGVYVLSETTAPATTYVDQSVASLSAGQAAGTASVIGANAARKAIVLTPPSDCQLRIASGGNFFWPLFGGVPNAFTGPDCHAGALFVTGLAAGVLLPIAEG